jgi:hypothetical protein
MTSNDYLASREAITRFLFVEDPPSEVDLCLVLGCPTPTNMSPAIELFELGLTDTILISGHGPGSQDRPECEAFRDYAVARGVPSSAIWVERTSTNTRENFEFSAPIVERRLGWSRVRKVALVAKPFHMRRAVMTARRHWPAHVELICRPSTEPDDPPAATWWMTEAGRGYVLRELKAIGEYALQGDLGGF